AEYRRSTSAWTCRPGEGDLNRHARIHHRSAAGMAPTDGRLLLALAPCRPQVHRTAYVDLVCRGAGAGISTGLDTSVRSGTAGLGGALLRLADTRDTAAGAAFRHL